ncbi:type IV secretory system conjugative DNA transfer family protein [Nocardia sp. NPDC004068]|uniref:type IV secretory system conjugative DNA transfer family protein n=1 Tax=Nocardia sp. NPDC004068 TaxID=3364303 RepID=UPI0036BD658C
MTIDRPSSLGPDTLVWQQVHWPHPLREAAALSLLTTWAAQKHAPLLILEARADVTGVEYLIGSRLRHAQAIRRTVEQLVRGSIVTEFESTDRATVSTTRRLRASTTNRPLEPVDAVASHRSILSALTAVGKNERLVIQAVLGPRHEPALPPPAPARDDQTVTSKLLQGILPDRRAEVRQALTRKLGQHGFEVVLRLGVHAVTAERRRTLLLGLAAAISTVEAAGVRLRLADDKPAHVNTPQPRWSLFMPSQHFSVPEVSSLIAWPISDHDSDQFPGQPPIHPKPVRPTPAVQAGTRTVALANAPGADGTIGYDVVDALRHTWITGPSGVGKSALLLNLIVQDLEANRPVVVIEPKDLIADLLERIPEHRKHDVVLLDPMDSAPVGLNPLDGRYRGNRTPYVVADSLFGMFKSIYGDNLGYRSEDILRNALLALAFHESTSLIMLPILLTNPGFRRSITQRVIKDDPYNAAWFWEKFDSLSPETATSIIAPLSNKLRPLLTKQLRGVLSQRSPKFDVRQVLTENKVLLVPLQKGVIGPESAQLLSAGVLYQLWNAILERAGTPEASRTPVMVYVDEAQEFLRFSQDLPDALAMARSLKAGFHVAHQHEAQLPKTMLEAFRNNARNRIAFQLQPGDAKNAAAGQSVLSPEDFSELPAYHIYARLVRDNSVQPWVSGVTLPPPPVVSNPEEIRRLSRAQYGQPLDEIEAGFAGLLDDISDTPTAMHRRRRQA